MFSKRDDHKVAARIALGLAGFFTVLIILLAVEDFLDHVLNEIAMREERERGGWN